MKLLNTPITVEADGHILTRIYHGNEIITVRRRLDFWRLQSDWWHKEEVRTYQLLETDSGILEVYRDGEGRWVLARRQD